MVTYWIETPRQEQQFTDAFLNVEVETAVLDGVGRWTDDFLSVCSGPIFGYLEVVRVPDDRVEEFEAFLEYVRSQGVEINMIGRSE